MQERQIQGNVVSIPTSMRRVKYVYQFLEPGVAKLQEKNGHQRKVWNQSSSQFRA